MQVFNFVLKLSTEFASLISLGSTFHNLGAAKGKSMFAKSCLGFKTRMTKQSHIARVTRYRLTRN